MSIIYAEDCIVIIEKSSTFKLTIVWYYSLQCVYPPRIIAACATLSEVIQLTYKIGSCYSVTSVSRSRSQCYQVKYLVCGSNSSAQIWRWSLGWCDTFLNHFLTSDNTNTTYYPECGCTWIGLTWPHSRSPKWYTSGRWWATTTRKCEFEISAEGFLIGKLLASYRISLR